jgi:hypothetical protein
LKGEGVTAAVSGAGRTKLEDDLTSGVHASVGDGEGPYRFGKNRGWAAASFWYWAEGFPEAQFHIFLSLLLLFSYFFSRFCINASNQLKRLSEIF